MGDVFVCSWHLEQLHQWAQRKRQALSLKNVKWWWTMLQSKRKDFTVVLNADLSRRLWWWRCGELVLECCASFSRNLVNKHTILGIICFVTIITFILRGKSAKFSRFFIAPKKYVFTIFVNVEWYIFLRTLTKLFQERLFCDGHDY